MNERVELPGYLVQMAASEAVQAQRTTSAQLAHWVRLGQLLDRSDTFRRDRLGSFLSGDLAIDQLDGDERTMASDIVFTQIAHGSDSRSLVGELKARNRPFFEGDDRYPDHVVCVHPDGRRELGRFEDGHFTPVDQSE